MNIDWEKVIEKPIPMFRAEPKGGTYKAAIDSIVEDLAPSLSIADASQMARRITKRLPHDMIDVDLG